MYYFAGPICSGIGCATFDALLILVYGGGLIFGLLAAWKLVQAIKKKDSTRILLWLTLLLLLLPYAIIAISAVTP